MHIEQTTLPAGASLADHHHPTLLLRLLDRGETIETTDLASSECSPGDIRITPAGTVQNIRAQDREVAVRLFSLRPHLQRALPGRLDKPLFLPAGSAADLPAPLFAALRSADLFTVECAVLELMARCLTGTCCTSSWVDDLREEIDHSAAHPHSLDSLSRTVGRHPSHVSRTFRARFGRSIGDHLLAHRLYQAARLLCDTEAPIITIALDLGFYDQPHFSRLFRRHFGASPGAYRSRHRMCT